METEQQTELKNLTELAIRKQSLYNISEIAGQKHHMT